MSTTDALLKPGLVAGVEPADMAKPNKVIAAPAPARLGLGPLLAQIGGLILLPMRRVPDRFRSKRNFSNAGKPTKTKDFKHAQQGPGVLR